MTANVFTEDVQKCLDAGMNAHIGKPVDIEYLKKILERCNIRNFISINNFGKKGKLPTGK